MLSTELNLWTPHSVQGCLETMTSPAHVAVNFLKGQGREIHDKADVQGLTLLIRKGLTERCHILVGWEGCSRRSVLIYRALSRDHQCRVLCCSVVSDSFRPHGLQHHRPPCPSPTPGVYSNSCPSSQWCHPTMSSLSSTSPPALSLSKHHGLFQWVGSSHQVTRVLELQY